MPVAAPAASPTRQAVGPRIGLSLADPVALQPGFLQHVWSRRGDEKYRQELSDKDPGRWTPRTYSCGASAKVYDGSVRKVMGHVRFA